MLRPPTPNTHTYTHTYPSQTHTHTYASFHVIPRNTAPVGLITVADKGARKLAYPEVHLKLKQIRKCRTQIKGEGQDKAYKETIKEK